MVGAILREEAQRFHEFGRRSGGVELVVDRHADVRRVNLQGRVPPVDGDDIVALCPKGLGGRRQLGGERPGLSRRRERGRA